MTISVCSTHMMSNFDMVVVFILRTLTWKPRVPQRSVTGWWGVGWGGVGEGRVVKCTHSSKSARRSTFRNKIGHKWVFEGDKLQKSSIFGFKRYTFLSPTCSPPKKNPDYRHGATDFNSNSEFHFLVVWTALWKNRPNPSYKVYLYDAP